jgi:formylglycine-generating enzyme required for sulfatase activity
MVVVPQGRFTMGAPAGEEARENLPNELRGSSIPQHLITIRHNRSIAKFDVTRDEYAQFVAETNRPDPDSCTTVSASATFIATNVAGWKFSAEPIRPLRYAWQCHGLD